MKRKREVQPEILIRHTTENRIAAFLDHGTRHPMTILATCPAYDHPMMRTFVQQWRATAIQQYIGFSLSYELSYLLREAEPAPSHHA